MVCSALVDRHRPLHLSIVGGEPLVRYRELNALLPILANRGIHTQVVTSAVRPIPQEWATLRRLQICVSIDGLQPEHDERRKPATYDRILKHIVGHQITVHCTVTRQQAQRPGYLDEFVRFWSENEQTRTIWISLYTPQVGEQSPESLTLENRRSVIATLSHLQSRYGKLQMPQTLIERWPTHPSHRPTASSRKRPSASRRTSPPKSRRASSGASQTARSAGASRRLVSPRLAGTGYPAVCGSARSSTRRSPSVDRCEPFEKPCPPPPSRRQPRKRLPPEPDHSARRASRSGRGGPALGVGARLTGSACYTSRAHEVAGPQQADGQGGGKFTKALVNTEHPLLVQIIPIRRCNIDCGYCNEYDKVSPPVPTEEMARRIDKLAELGTLGRRLQRRRADAASRARSAHRAASGHTA